MDSIFERTIGLIGQESFNKIKDKTIAVIGLGGVGGTTLEALARTGFQRFVIVDFETVEASNLNRQLLYTFLDINKYKTEVAKNRIISINPDANVEILNIRINNDSVSLLDGYHIDFLVDAIDDVEGKLSLIKYGFSKDIPCIISLGMANKMIPSQVEITSLDKTSYDPLAKKMRQIIGKAGIKTSKVVVAFSKEVKEVENKKLNSTMFVPSSAGLNIASYVFSHFIYN